MGTPRSADLRPGGATRRGDELSPKARGILDSVARVFADRGSAVSMTEIAARSGVGRATLYRYFPTREVLMVELQRVAVQDVGHGLRAANLDQIVRRGADIDATARTVVGGLPRRRRGERWLTAAR
jgi:AcrR family transcriptional regulator